MNINTLSMKNFQKCLINSNGSWQNLHRYISTTLKINRYGIPMSQVEIDRNLQKIKHRKRGKLEKYIPSTISLQVLGCGAPGSPAALYVSTDHSKYLFNCGEGTQRLAHEHHLRLTKLEHVFFTTPTWKNMGGLPGMALTLQDSGVPEIHLHGPKGIIDIFETVKRFALMTQLTVCESNCNENYTYRDSCMTIRYVPLISDSTESDSDSHEPVAVDNTDYYAHELNQNGKRAREQKKYNKFAKVEQSTSNLRKIRGCVAYICKLHGKPGKLNLEKCVEKGITPGPILGNLKCGNDVTLPNGTVVKSSDVCDPETPGPVFIVLECPSDSYLESLINNKVFCEYQADEKNEENWAACVIHFTPENILKTDRYRDWMKKFPKSTEHLIINETNNCPGFEALHRIQHKLNLLHPTIFPLMHYSVHNKNNEVQASKEDEGLRIHRAKTLNAFHLRPLQSLDADVRVKLDRTADINEAFNVDGFLDVLAELQTNVNDRSKALGNCSEYPKIIVLGTGSCIPSKARNASGLLLRINAETSIVLDCGEGSMGQIIRFFGPDKSDEVLKTIKGIFVSHLHADHHLGLLGILQQRERLTSDPVIVFAPKQMYSWLQLYHVKFEPIRHYFSLIPNQNLVMNSHTVSPIVYEELRTQLNLREINTVEVNHCPHAFGVALTLENGQKIVYSGDTKPCNYLVDIGKNCDLLIHEATMEDQMEEEANKKMHSTMSQAIKIGEKMNAKYTLLTHFSQRYSKMPRVPENSEDLRLDNVGIAFDNMNISLSELPLLPLFYQSLRVLFSEYVSLLEEKTEKRLRREGKDRLGSR